MSATSLHGKHLKGRNGRILLSVSVPEPDIAQQAVTHSEFVEIIYSSLVYSRLKIWIK